MPPAHYNAAEDAYEDNLRRTNAEGCDTKLYPLSPIAEFKRRLDQLAPSTDR
jgi:hypothetical protein